MKFVEFNKREYHNSGYYSIGILVSISDIARIVERIDDFSCTNIVTKDGKIHTLNERYADVVKKIREAEGTEEVSE